MGALPEVEKAEHRLGLLALSQVRIGVAERAGIGVLGEEDQDAGLAPAALGHIVALDARVRAVVGHGVEVEVERTGGEQRLVAAHRAVPGAEQGAGVFRRDARGVLAEIALLRDAVESAEQPQPLVGHQRHHVALALDGPELEREAGTQRVGAGDHLRAGQPGGVGHRLEPQAHQVGHEQEQSPAAGDEASRGEGEGARVGHRFHGGAWQLGALLVEASGQRGEAELAQHLAHGGGAERRALVFERLGDFVHGVVALAQPLDGGARGGLLRLALGAAHGGEEERRLGVAAEVVAQHAERAFGVAELGGDLLRGALVDEVAAQRLVLALLGVQGLEEEAPAFRYLFRCPDRHACTVSHISPSVNRIATRWAPALANYGKTGHQAHMPRTDGGRTGGWRIEGGRVNQSYKNTSSGNIEPGSATPPTAAQTPRCEHQ